LVQTIIPRNAPTVETNHNAFSIVKQQVDKCAAILGLSPEVTEMLKHPVRELHVSLPVRMDDGSLKVFQGFRVQYNDLEMLPGGPAPGRRQGRRHLQS
jgi:glutamate dehydrogenase/leucine dehydrogenase